jgi:hypothetical protein
MMRPRTIPYLAVGVAALAAAAAPAGALMSGRSDAPGQVQQAGAKQAVVSGFFRGETVRYFDYGPIKLKAGNKLAPIWTVTNGAAGQRNIIDAVPGQKAYSPLWSVSMVTWASDATPRVLRSAADVRRAAAAGEVTIKKTGTVVNCPVLGFGQKRTAGFSGGRVIHYYDLGPVKVAPGNDVVPLYAVTNGVAGQHNVTEDTLAPGQTAYPPLWSIRMVTWKTDASPRLLRSYAQIERAEDAGEVTVKRTSLVVNCPVV